MNPSRCFACRFLLLPILLSGIFVSSVAGETATKENTLTIQAGYRVTDADDPTEYWMTQHIFTLDELTAMEQWWADYFFIDRQNRIIVDHAHGICLTTLLETSAIDLEEITYLHFIAENETVTFTKQELLDTERCCNYSLPEIYHQESGEWDESDPGIQEPVEALVTLEDDWKILKEGEDPFDPVDMNPSSRFRLVFGQADPKEREAERALGRIHTIRAEYDAPLSFPTDALPVAIEPSMVESGGTISKMDFLVPDDIEEKTSVNPESANMENSEVEQESPLRDPDEKFDFPDRSENVETTQRDNFYYEEFSKKAPQQPLNGTLEYPWPSRDGKIENAEESAAGSLLLQKRTDEKQSLHTTAWNLMENNLTENRISKDVTNDVVPETSSGKGADDGRKTDDNESSVLDGDIARVSPISSTNDQEATESFDSSLVWKGGMLIFLFAVIYRILKFRWDTRM